MFHSHKVFFILFTITLNGTTILLYCRCQILNELDIKLYKANAFFSRIQVPFSTGRYVICFSTSRYVVSLLYVCLYYGETAGPLRQPRNPHP